MQIKEQSVRFSLILPVLILVLLFLYLVRGILLPFIISIIIAYLLNPLVSYFENRGIKRNVVVIFLYLLFLLTIIVSVSFLFPLILKELSALRESLPHYAAAAKNFLGSWKAGLEKILPSEGIIFSVDSLTHKWNAYLNKLLSIAPRYLRSIFSLFSLFILIPFISFFILSRGKEFIHQIFNFFPSRYVETVLSLICEVDEALGNFLRGQIIAASCVGLLSILGLYALEIDYALLLGIIAGLGNLIPFLGPIMGAVPASLIALFKFKSFLAVLKVIALFAGIQFLDNVLISPYVVGKSVNLHPLLIIFALLAGAELFGLLGIILGVPIACAVKVIVQIFLSRFRQPAIKPVKERILT